jgi:hypothetical protein
MVGKAIQSLLHPHNFKQFKTITLNPFIRVKLPCVRITIGRFRPIVVAFVPMLAYGTFSGAKGHYTGCFELDFVSWHD